jgi:chromosome segregation ATPase
MKKKKTAKKPKNVLPQLEKEFKNLSSRLIIEFRREINLLIQQTKNLNGELIQIDKIQQLAHKKSTQLALRKNQLNASEKKQWKAANKLQQELGKRISFLTAKLPTLENEIKILEKKQDFYANLIKESSIKKNAKNKEMAQSPTREPLLQPPMFPNFSNLTY